jgi:hypothetical protein
MKQNLKDNCFEQLYSNLKQIVDLGEVSLTGHGKGQLELLLKASEAHLKVSYSQSSRIADLEQALKKWVTSFDAGTPDDWNLRDKTEQLLNK